MTNNDKYKKAFSVLHASDNLSLEVKNMETNKKNYIMKKSLAACAAAAIAFGSLSVAYAADIGGIQQKISSWFHGIQTELNVKDEGNGNYSYTFTDEDGNVHESAAGGIAIDDDGNEIPLSAEEVLDVVNSSDIEEDSAGRVWLYYYDQKIEITDLFDENGLCRVAAEYNGQKEYFDITKSESEDGTNEKSYSFGSTTETPKNADCYIPVKQESNDD